MPKLDRTEKEFTAELKNAVEDARRLFSASSTPEMVTKMAFAMFDRLPLSDDVEDRAEMIEAFERSIEIATQAFGYTPTAEMALEVFDRLYTADEDDDDDEDEDVDPDEN